MKIFKKLIVFVLLLSIVSCNLTSLFAASYVNVNHAGTAETNNMVFRDPVNNRYFGVYQVKYTDKYVYCVDYLYGLRNGSTPVRLDQDVKFSNKLVQVMEYGFPNVSAKDLGVNSEAEAYTATEMAVWEIAKTYENRDASKTFDINKIEVCVKSEAGDRIIAAAKKIANKVKNTNYEVKFELDSKNAKTEILNDKFVAGPYKINAENCKFENYKVNINNDQAIITDKDGNKIEDNTVKADQEFYINWPTTQEGSTMDINVSAKVEMKKVILCVTDAARTQDFALEVSDTKELTAKDSLTWETIKKEEPKDEELVAVPTETEQAGETEEIVEAVVEQQKEEENKEENKEIEPTIEVENEKVETLPVTGGLNTDIVIVMLVVAATICGYFVIGKKA